MNPNEMYVSGLQLDHEEHEVSFQPFQRDDLHRKRIGRCETFLMRLQEGLPWGALAALWRRGNPVVEQNPFHGVPADRVAEVGQGAADPRVAPSRILDGHPHHQLGNRLGCRRPTTTTVGAAIVLLGDQSPIPAQDRVSGDDARNLAEDSPAELLPTYGEPTPLCVGQAECTTTQLLSEDSILLTEIVDQIFLVTPAGDGEDEEVQRKGHPVRLSASVPG